MNKKMKRILASLAAAAAMSSVCLIPNADLGISLPIKTLEANAADVVISGDYEYYVNDDGAVISKYTGSETAVSIPAEIDGNKVYAIDSQAFEKNKTITSVTLPSNIKRIADHAFRGCENLVSISLNEGLEYLGSYAFTGTGITEVTLPTTLESADYPFENSNVKKATFAKGTKLIPGWIFNKCSTLEEVNVPETVETIGSSAFRYCPSLTEFKFHEGIKYLGSYSFTGTGITEVTLPTTLETADYPFENSNVKKATFAKGTKLIPGWIFNKCSTLEEVNVPETVETIGSSAFRYCPLLTEFKFHEGIKYLGSYSFTGTGITEVTLPTTLESADYPFENSNVKKATFAQGATLIPSWIFNKCSTLKEVNLPDTVNTIGSYAFRGCSSLNEIALPAKLEKINNDVFVNSGLKSIEIPDSVTSLGYSTFSNCPKLKTASVGSGLKAINSKVFASCPVLEKVTFSSEKLSLDDNVFYNCRSLSDVDYSKTDLSFKTTTFANCYSLKDMNLIYLSRPKSTMTTTTEKAAVDGTIDFTVEFEALAGHYSADTDFTIELTVPDGVTVLPDTFKTDAGAISIEDASSIKIPFSTSKGKLTFSAKANESGTYDIDADLVFKDVDNKKTRREPIHSVRFTADVLSLSVPSVVNSFKTNISGTGPKGQIIEIYLGDKLIGNPIADENTGKFDIPLELPEGKSGTEYVLKAKYGDMVTSDCTIVYSQDEPAVNSVKFGINGKKADKDITEVFTKCTSPVMYLDPSKELNFVMDITNSKNVEKVFVTSTKGDKIAKIEATYDENSGLWTASGYFDNNKNYVPGTLNIVVVSTADLNALNAAKLDIDYSDGYYSRPGNIRFAVDPSGIVYEGAPSNPVEGAEVTVYYMDENGKAVKWDSKDYDQQNPIITDEFGAFAWDVPEGEWKVVCKAEGFDTVESEWKEVPPVQTGINFALVSTEAPKVTDISYDGSDITLKFSKYMLPDTVSADTVILSDGNDIKIKPVIHANGEEVTDEFVISGNFDDVIDVKVSVSEGCRSYADSAAVAYEKSVHINDALVTTEAVTTTTVTAISTTTSTAASTTTSAATTTTTTTPAAAKAGDVNGDGSINLKDVTVLRRYIAGGWNVKVDEKVADVNKDGNVNLKDVVMLRRYIAGGWNIKL